MIASWTTGVTFNENSSSYMINQQDKEKDGPADDPMPVDVDVILQMGKDGKFISQERLSCRPLSGTRKFEKNYRSPRPLVRCAGVAAALQGKPNISISPDRSTSHCSEDAKSPLGKHTAAERSARAWLMTVDGAIYYG
jgi:hypothetical protein